MKYSSKTVIVIPVFNGERFLRRSLASCLSQTTPTIIWVVDNRSTDKSTLIVREFQKKNKNIALFKNTSNLGRVGNWNQCLKLFERSSFKYIKFLFAGDELFPTCIEEMETAFSLDSNIGAVSSLYEFIDLKGNRSISEEIIKRDKLLSVKEINYVNLYHGGILGAIICNMYSKKAIGEYKFNELFVGKADFDFEVLSKNKAYFINKPLARFNLDAHRTFFKAQDYWMEAEFVFNRAYHLEKNKTLFSRKAYQMVREKILIEFVTRSIRYYPLKSVLRLLTAVMLKLSENLGIKIPKRFI